ncbi:MAG: hypothetical protein BRD23_05020 [Halobacteriales archaeon SW_9_67_25]|nr:MAG: hypothetical protein BRD23_05020 [Halobacteriales archaeon SW_9_67_25]
MACTLCDLPTPASPVSADDVDGQFCCQGCLEVAVVIVMAVAAGNYYEGRVKRGALEWLSALTAQRIDEARRRSADGTETVRIEELQPGDEVVVRPGEKAVGGAVVTDGRLVLGVGKDATSTLDRVVALDKTGTLTTGEMRVLDWSGDKRTLRRAGAVEQYADHPVAEAIAEEAGATGATITGFETHPGSGASARLVDEAEADEAEADGAGGDRLVPGHRDTGRARPRHCRVGRGAGTGVPARDPQLARGRQRFLRWAVARHVLSPVWLRRDRRATRQRVRGNLRRLGVPLAARPRALRRPHGVAVEPDPRTGRSRVPDRQAPRLAPLHDDHLGRVARGISGNRGPGAPARIGHGHRPGTPELQHEPLQRLRGLPAA